MTITKIPIWLDCDPGHDDAVAILLACYHPGFQLLGISSCFGNSSPQNTDYNTRSLLTAMGKIYDIPTYRGAQKPWKRKQLKYAPDIHGYSGLDGTTLLPLPKLDSSNKVSYLDAIERAILDNENQISLLSTGALTSYATLFKTRPYLREKVKYISIMGGGFNHMGNVNINMTAEFNMWIDPHAAQFVFRDTILKSKCILCPLNLTHRAIATDLIDKRILDEQNESNNLRLLFYELFQYFKSTYKDNQGFQNGPPIHDPMTLYPLLQFYGWETSNIIQFKFKRFDIDIVTDVDNPDIGMTFPIREYENDIDDDADTFKTGQGIIVGYNINIEYFWDQILSCLNTAQEFSTIENQE